MTAPSMLESGDWELFPHGADVGLRGRGATRDVAFANAAYAMTAALAEADQVRPLCAVEIFCDAPDDELLLVDWLNALIYEMVTRKMLFRRFRVRIEGEKLFGEAWGELIDIARHKPGVEIKGATYTALRVAQETDGRWLAQCVVDV
jgi:protein archease